MNNKIVFVDFKSKQTFNHSPVVSCDCCGVPIVLFRDTYIYTQDDHMYYVQMGGIICKSCIETAIDLNLKVTL